MLTIVYMMYGNRAIEPSPFRLKTYVIQIYIKSLGRSNFFILELEFIIDKRMIL